MLYNINDKLPAKRLLVAAMQQVIACFVATVLIPQICGVPIAPAMLGAALGTLCYQLITRGQSPMFISSSGAFVAAVMGALALGTAPNYLAVFIGGLIVCIVYFAVGLAINHFGTAWINKVLPPVVIGPIVAVIGLNLATFIPTYFQINGQYSLIGFGLGMLTLIITALISHYGKGFIKNLPFLVAIIIVYGFASLLTVCGVPVIDFSVFNNISIVQVPDFSFLHFGSWDWTLLPQILLLFVPLSLVTLCEHTSDHKALSAVIGTDLTQKPGLGYTLMGDGAATALGTLIGAMPNTSYGESVGTTGFSKICSKYVITLAAIIMGIAAFIGPLQAFLVSIPSAIFGGCAAILYGYITLSGIRTIKDSNIDLNNNKNVTIIASVLTLGVSGAVCNFGVVSIGTTALAMIVGIMLNFMLKEKKKPVKKGSGFLIMRNTVTGETYTEDINHTIIDR
jgi:uracil permease